MPVEHGQHTQQKKKKKKKRRALPGRALLAKGSNAKGALRSNARVRC